MEAPDVVLRNIVWDGVGLAPRPSVLTLSHLAVQAAQRPARYYPKGYYTGAKSPGRGEGGGKLGGGGFWGPAGGGGVPWTYMAQNDRLVALIILSHIC